MSFFEQNFLNEVQFNPIIEYAACLDIISLADALMLQNVEQCSDVFLMFIYDTGVVNAAAANALYKQMCKALESSSRSHRDAKIAMFIAHSTRFMKVAARQWKSRNTASGS